MPLTHPPRRTLSLLLISFVLAASISLGNAQSVTIAAAGDISCSPDSDRDYKDGEGTPTRCQMKATSDLILERNVDAVLTLGDNQYSTGRLAAYEESYDATWGRFKDITYPVPGNHEYYGGGAEGYFDYFGERAGDPDKGYYSYDLGGWHLVALNSNCKKVGGCDEGSPQATWLKEDLAANPNACTLAYWHHPRFSSGRHGSDSDYDTFWETLTTAGVELVLSGHDHSYERFAPQTPDSKADDAGVRQFVAGSGGVGFYDKRKERANSETFIEGEFGVLFLTLNENSYDWSFVSTAGETLDSGTESCH